MKKNEEYTVTIHGYTAEGMGVCRVDGQVVFIAGVLDGEQWVIRIVKVLAQHAYGIPMKCIVPSPHRVEPDCPYNKKCGGCALRHMDYAEELRFKSEKVRDALNRLGGCSVDAVPILGAEEITGYRNKALFPVGMVNGRAEGGFFRARSHEIVPVERCLLQSPAADAAKGAVIDWMRQYAVAPYDETAHKGLVRHVYVRSAFGTGELLVCVVVNGTKLPKEEQLVDAVRAAVPAVTSIVLNENTREGNAVLGSAFRILWGADTIDDTLCGLRFRLSPRSFYQVNRAQAQRLYELAISMAGLEKTDTVLDLYCGTGTITLAMARHCGTAIGVEIIPAAIADAEENARRNGIENARFFCADAGETATKLAEEGTRPDVVTVDPPRKGLTPEVIAAVGEMAPRRVVYVSCDPGTLGRDIARFREQGYTLTDAHAVDLFPRTAHIETVVLLEKAE